ncbi:MFS transporter [Halorarum salinum]|uniref:MFS transporter n=1 Tax=Halorarum salinum TaxID=2743089 RepID=A0A7D5QCX6_9EURY|nr:MFS transporter [Halobaculum salinum]QLG61721.1 MFS transporter [Halobaculum salinum]
MRWHYRHTVLALCTFAFFATMVARLAISPVVPSITADFDISNTVIGFALTGMWMSYAFAQFPSGVLGDRYGERLVVLLAIGGTAVMSFLIAVAPAFPVFLVCVVVLGAVAGLHYSTATNLLTRTHDDIGTAIGVHTIGAPAGGLIAPVAAAWIGVRYGWRPAVAIGSAIAAPVFVLFALRVRSAEPRRPDQPIRERLHVGPMLELLGRPSIVFTAVIASVGAFVWQGTASFLPTFLIEHRGLSSTAAGVVFSSYFVVQAIVKPGLGVLSDRYDRDLAIAVSVITSALGMVLFIVGAGVVSIVAAVLLVGTGLGMAVTVEPRFMDELSEPEQGIGFGLVRTVYLLVSSLGSVAVGFLADTYGWATSFWVLVALLALIVCSLVVNQALGLGY